MIKNITLLLAGLLITIMASSQTSETLTNSSILKMSKARLTDELIIDMIRTSSTSFDLSSNALKSLERENVSPQVIEAMKSTSGIQNISTEKKQSEIKPDETGKAKKPEKPDTKLADPGPVQKPAGKPEPDNQAGKGSVPAAVEPVTAVNVSQPTHPEAVTALNYITPLTDLIKFNEKEFDTFKQEISDWDKQIRNLKSEARKSKDQLGQAEKNLMKSINSDTKPFNDEIKSLNADLKKSRGKFEKSKTEALEGGLTIAKNLETAKNDRLRSLSKAYGEAGQKVESAPADPVIGESKTEIDLTPKSVTPETSDEIIYANEILSWYQNEIIAIKKLIEDWNPRVEKLISEDTRLRKQLEPVEGRLEELKSNPKQNKADISSIKKEISRIEKERKKLADQMKDDRKELSSLLKQLSDKNRDSVSERFTDIIDNVNYSFREKLSL